MQQANAQRLRSQKVKQITEHAEREKKMEEQREDKKVTFTKKLQLVHFRKNTNLTQRIGSSKKSYNDLIKRGTCKENKDYT